MTREIGFKHFPSKIISIYSSNPVPDRDNNHVTSGLNNSYSALRAWKGCTRNPEELQKKSQCDPCPWGV